MKIYLFIQDHQMFYDSVIKFSCEKEIPENILEECATGNGRISQSFNEFSQSLENKGYKITPMHIEEIELFDGFLVCPVVYGDSGNY